jgi:hypothetical protein
MAAYDDLLGFMRDQGFTDLEAQHAVKRCVIAMAKHGAGAYAGAGAIAFFMNMTPASAMGFATVTLAGGAAHGLATSPQCKDIREAISFWNTADTNFAN